MQTTLHTNRGDIVIDLFDAEAPETVANFVGLAKGEPTPGDKAVGQDRTEPFFDGLAFHRVISGFMIQGGCPEGTGTGGPGYNFDDEVDNDLTYSKPYLLAMANAGIRAGRGTNGSQFFITVVPTPHLQGKHTIFGEVSNDESKAVVDAIAITPTGRGDRPTDPVIIERVTVSE